MPERDIRPVHNQFDHGNRCLIAISILDIDTTDAGHAITAIIRDDSAFLAGLGIMLEIDIQLHAQYSISASTASNGLIAPARTSIQSLDLGNN